MSLIAAGRGIYASESRINVNQGPHVDRQRQREHGIIELVGTRDARRAGDGEDLSEAVPGRCVHPGADGRPVGERVELD